MITAPSRPPSLVLLIAALLCAGCYGPRAGGGDGPLSPAYLQLNGFVSVAEDGALQGLLRWQYLADDPSQYDEPRTYCELWEELQMQATEAADCAGCDELFAGSAQWMSGEGDCPAPNWSDRSLALGFGDIAGIDEGLSGAAEDGATHFLSSSWAPDLGGGGMEQLFFAIPKQWLEEGSPVGSPAGQAVLGDYRIESLFWWETDQAPLD